MPDQLQTIVQRMIDAGESEENIGTVIQHFKAQSGSKTPVDYNNNQGPKTGALGGGIGAAWDQVKNYLSGSPSPLRDNLLADVKAHVANVANGAAEFAPAAGGMAGAALGAPAGPAGSIAGAAVGGSVGEAGKQMIHRATGQPLPASGMDAAKDIAVQGAVQGALQGTGEALAAGASKAAPWLMNRALNLTDRLSREFPEMSANAIDKAITVSKGGLKEAKDWLVSQKALANDALQTAHAKGVTIPITAATDGLQNTVGKVMNSSDIEGGLAQLASVERKITAGRAATLTPMEADALKTALQTESKPLYAAAKMGNGRPNVSVKAQALSDMAQSLNQHIGDLTSAAGADGYRAANAEAQQAIGAIRGVTHAIRPGSNLYQAMVRPGVGMMMGAAAGRAEGGDNLSTVGGALIGGALTSPAGMSTIATALAKPGVQIILRGAPRLAEAVAAYLSKNDDTTEQASVAR